MKRLWPCLLLLAACAAQSGDDDGAADGDGVDAGGFGDANSECRAQLSLDPATPVFGEPVHVRIDWFGPVSGSPSVLLRVLDPDGRPITEEEDFDKRGYRFVAGRAGTYEITGAV